MSRDRSERSVKYEETRRIQFHIIAAHGISPKIPKQAPKGYNPFVIVEGPDVRETLRTATSTSKDALIWHENLPTLTLRLNSTLTFTVKHRSGIPLLKSTPVTIGSSGTFTLSQLLEKQGQIDRQSSFELDIETDSKSTTRAFLMVNIREIQTRERTEEISAQDAAAYRKKILEAEQVGVKEIYSEINKMSNHITQATLPVPCSTVG